MRTSIVTTTVLALVTVGSLGLGSTTASAAPAGVSAKPHATKFAFYTSGYGTRVRGGQVPAGSGTSAYEIIGCTNNAGVTRGNHVTEEQLPGVGKASQVTTTVRTLEKKGVVTSRSENTIARIVLNDSPLGSVSIKGIKSVASAFHDDSGFHTATTSDIASITLTDPTGTETPLDAPAPGQPLDIPGVATITVGKHVVSSNANGARAVSDVINIYSTATGSRVKVAHTVAELHGGIKSGIFGGYASGARGNGLDGNASVGRTPYQQMPCQGTDGKLQTNATAALNLGGQAVVSGLEDKQRSKQTNQRAWGFEQGRVASINLGDGQLVVDGIVGRVNVERSGANLNKLDRDIKGTTIGSITASGEPMEFPNTDTLMIPGVAKLERNVVEKIGGGLMVTALKITVLDGTAATIELGQARLSIRKTGL